MQEMNSKSITSHVNKHVGVILKFDFEKAYDRANWDFLLRYHVAKGFGDFWCNWIKQILYNGTVSIKLNNECGPYF
jgi:hypothetical protein